jgi:hypothetical protein
VITAEPAVVVDLDFDEEDVEVGSIYEEQRRATLAPPHHIQPGELLRHQMSASLSNLQPGQMLRRTSVAQKRRTSTLKEDDSDSSHFYENPWRPQSVRGGLMSPTGYSVSPRRRNVSLRNLGMPPTLVSPFASEIRMTSPLAKLPESPVL